MRKPRRNKKKQKRRQGLKQAWSSFYFQKLILTHLLSLFFRTHPFCTRNAPVSVTLKTAEGKTAECCYN
ncbi:hypothetical protein HMPREF0083_01300 [Aneurinibacillus aneurinilyticus ATCC 12856]|uniref:Uncharacterized protein n=1 Tax=Aneurinibacillus aneurinilyticus ATCC 12856 TaxID=649747 RepID=U1YES3_ANEAE|nr:hypothetical protein HMPREF0083_01300 [Aneurinibacillus aneurinilyticus ATCC 12856]